MKKAPLVAILVLLMLPFGVALGQPSVSQIEPLGAARGSVLRVRFEGERLSSVTDILFYRTGMKLVSIDGRAEDQMIARINVASDAPLGEHLLQLVSDNGISRVCSLHVGPFPSVKESEPNSTLDQAQPLELGVTVEGMVDEADVDFYAVHLEQGQRLSAEVEALRLGRFLFDAHLEILSEEGKVLARCDDSPLHRQDPVVSIVAPTRGDYLIRIREAAFGGDEDSVYRLHVGDYPRPTVVYPAGGQVGEELNVRFIGDPTGEITERLTVPPNQGNREIFPAADQRHETPSGVPFRLTSLPNLLEKEPNDAPDAATKLEFDCPVAFNGILGEPGDVDFFAFSATQGQQLEFAVHGARIASPIDSVITIFDAFGRELVRNDDGIIHDSTLRFVSPSSGVFLLRVEDHLKRGGKDFVYRVEATLAQPQVMLQVASNANDLSQHPAIVIPRGSRFPVQVVCRRRDFAGNLRFRCPDLPTGIRMDVQPVLENTHLGMMLFEAAESCPLGAQLIELEAVGDFESGSVTGALLQPIGLVYGPPRRTLYHSAVVTRVPLVVTEEAPFEIEVASPKAAMVRDGEIDLTVRAKRRAGFSEAIQIRLPHLPPWISELEPEFEIPAGVDAATISLIADENAEHGSWELLALATSETDDGVVQVASNFFTLQLSERYLDIAIHEASAASGDSVKIHCDLRWNRDFSGLATAKLKGLPKNSATFDLTVTPGAKSLDFTVTTTEETPASIHNTLFVELALTENGERITHFLGRGGTLEVFERGSKPQNKKSRLQILREALEARAVPGVSPVNQPSATPIQE